MFNSFLCVVFQASVGPFLGISLEKMLTSNDIKTRRWQRVLCWSLIWLFLAVMKTVFVGNNWVQILSYLLAFVLVIIFMKYFYNEPLWKKIMSPTLLMICTVIADFIVQLFIFHFFDGVTLTFDYTSSYMVFASFFVTLLTVLIYFIISIIWCRLLKRGLVLNHPFVFIALLLSEICSLLPSMMIYFKNGGELLFEYDFLIVSSLIMTFSLAYILFDQSEKDIIQNELNEVKRVMEIEKEHYRNLEKYSEEMSKIRHDYNNYISTVLYLIHSGKTEEAKGLLKDLEKRLK